MRGALAGDAFDRILLFLDVLDIQRGNHVDTAVEQLLHILPALGMLAVRRIVEGELVHQSHFRLAFQNAVDIQSAGSGHLDDGDLFRYLFSASRLDRADHHILAALLAPVAFIEHADGFADAGSVTEEDLQPAAPQVCFLALQPAQQFVGGWSSISSGYHFALSRARFSNNTLTRGSPRTPSWRPSI